MAKELPYFKFEPNEWDNGNIQVCTHEEKGVFIDLCCMYWARLGDITYKLAVQKICGGNATALDSLCENKIFEIINGNIFIKYLSEQLEEFDLTSKKNSKNAKEGWENRRKQKVLSERNATASVSQSERIAIREEKRRGKQIKEEKIIKEIISENKFSASKEFKKPFEDFYFQKTGEKYYWTGKDASKCNSVSKKIIFKIKERNPEKIQISDSEIINGFMYVLSIIKDSWILSNLSMAIIDSKFNEIILQKNGKQSTSDARKQSLENLRAESRAVLAKHSNTNSGDGSIQFKSEPD